MPIRVMHFRREVPTGGGPESLILGISRCLDRSRFDLCVTTFGSHNGRRSAWLDDLRDMGASTLVVPARHRFDAGTIKRLAQLLDEHEIDVLHTHDHRTNLIGYLATRRRPTPLVATLHQPLRRHWWLRHFEMMDDLLIRRFDRVLPVAEMIRQEVLAKRPDLADRVTTVLNGVDLMPFREPVDPSRVREEFGIPPGAILCATVGRLSDDKGLPYLLECARRVQERRDDVYWLIAGRGPLAETLEARTGEMGLADRVLFAGFRTDVPGVLAASDMLVVASTSEGCPVIVLEAMAAGRPVVVTAVGGTPEIVEDPTIGRVVEPRRPDLLADAVLELADAPQRRAQMGEEAARRAHEQFSIERMVGRFEDVYTELAATRRR